jgi:hypothetical protein
VILGGILFRSNFWECFLKVCEFLPKTFPRAISELLSSGSKMPLRNTKVIALCSEFFEVLSHVLSLHFGMLFIFSNDASVSYCKISALQDGWKRVEEAY